MIRMVMKMRDRNACIKDMPADLMAVNSELSPKFPNVIRKDPASRNGCEDQGIRQNNLG